MVYRIYDDYRGEEESAPKPGIVLIQKTSTDYQYMVKLIQVIDHYNLPVYLDVINDYGSEYRQKQKKEDKNIFSKIHFEVGK